MSITLSNIGEKVLLMGFFLTPFTSLRFGLVGPGEILILLAALIALISGGGVLKLDERIQILYRFWAGFLSVSVLGIVYNSFLFRAPSGRLDTLAFDSLSYIFILISIVATGSYSRNRADFSPNFFQPLFLCWSFVYVILYAVSFFAPSIFGMPLRYYHFFSPLVDNIHQAASVTCVMGFIALFLAAQSPEYLTRLFYIITAALFAMMALDSGSTKAMLGIVLGTVVSILFLIAYRKSGKGKYFLNRMFLIIITMSVLVLFSLYQGNIEGFAVQFFSENDGGGARESLYGAGFNHGLDSLLVGYGPGSHAPHANGFSDAHNTVLTIFLQSGIPGLLVFALFTARLLQKLSINFALLGVFAATGSYVLGGDILRRLPIWIIIMGTVYFAADVSIGSASSVRGASLKGTSKNRNRA